MGEAATLIPFQVTVEIEYVPAGRRNAPDGSRVDEVPLG